MLAYKQRKEGPVRSSCWRISVVQCWLREQHMETNTSVTTGLPAPSRAVNSSPWPLSFLTVETDGSAGTDPEATRILYSHGIADTGRQRQRQRQRQRTQAAHCNLTAQQARDAESALGRVDCPQLAPVTASLTWKLPCPCPCPSPPSSHIGWPGRYSTNIWLKPSSVSKGGSGLALCVCILCYVPRQAVARRVNGLMVAHAALSVPGSV